jgi:hypothetical protein
LQRTGRGAEQRQRSVPVLGIVEREAELARIGLRTAREIDGQDV